MHDALKIAIVIPAKNEAESIGHVLNGLNEVARIDSFFKINSIIVCDNNSTDNTQMIAVQSGVTVLYEEVTGYGYACKKALSKIRNEEIIVFVDGDDISAPHQLEKLLLPFKDNIDLVIGSRLKGVMENGALYWHQIMGNKLAVSLINYLWKVKFSDLGPLRAIRKDVLNEIQMKSNTFGWTVEMQVKAILHHKAMVEVPVNTSKRYGKSKISGTFSGTFLAAIGIFGKIFELWLKEKVNMRVNLSAKYE